MGIDNKMTCHGQVIFLKEDDILFVERVYRNRGDTISVHPCSTPVNLSYKVIPL